MPPKRTTPKWDIWPDPFRSGYIEGRPSRNKSRPQRAVAVWKGCPHALQLTFEERNRAKAVKLAREWIRAIERGEIPDPTKATKSVAANSEGRRGLIGDTVTIREARAVFLDAKHPKPPDHMSSTKKRRMFHLRGTYERAILRVFPHDFILNDTEVDYYVKKWLAEPIGVAGGALAPGTAHQWASKLSAFISYCIEARWLSVNPFKLAPKIDYDPKRKHRHYTADEMRKVLRRLSVKGRRQAERLRRPTRLLQLPNLLRVVGLTGMRDGEAASLLWEESVRDREQDNYVTSDAIVLNNTKTDAQRILPISLFPGLAAVLAHQREYAKANRGKVFPYPTSMGISTEVTKALKAEKIPVPKRPIHVLRSMVGERWHERGMPDELIAHLLGNSENSFNANYRKDRPIEERVGMVLRQMEPYLKGPRDQSAINQPSSTEALENAQRRHYERPSAYA